jgi:DNA polymerase III alpha subunit
MIDDMPKVPNRFVGLHSHTGFSPYDGLGYPDEHFSWCLENGLDAMAITEHGNASSYAHAALWAEKWNASNKDKPFKYIPGVEAYFHPDLKQWRVDKLEAEQAADDKKAARKLQTKQEQIQTKLVAVTDEDDETIEMSNALTIENEDESKSSKFYNPVNRRHHLVLLPKNPKGLLKIFSAISKGFLHGFYRFPRIDTDVLKEIAKDDDVIASSACIAGLPAFNVFREVQQLKFDELNQLLLEDPALMEKCVTAIGNTYDLMTGALGKKNYFLELQFNRLPAQNLVNRAILEFANRNGVQDQLIVTCDSHYARPEYWKERELYKKLGFMNYQEYSPDSLPKSREELKCEL